jgi:hypothetical protein
MRTKLCLPVMPILLAISLLFIACNGEGGNNDGRKKCYEAYDLCLKACEDAFSKALEDDIACRAKCNADYNAALEKCLEETDPVKRKKCEKDALDALTSCLNACTEKYNQAMKANTECRNKCSSDLQECLSKL